MSTASASSTEQIRGVTRHSSTEARASTSRRGGSKVRPGSAGGRDSRQRKRRPPEPGTARLAVGGRVAQHADQGAVGHPAVRADDARVADEGPPSRRSPCPTSASRPGFRTARSGCRRRGRRRPPPSGARAAAAPSRSPRAAPPGPRAAAATPGWPGSRTAGRGCPRAPPTSRVTSQARQATPPHTGWKPGFRPRPRIRTRTASVSSRAGWCPPRWAARRPAGVPPTAESVSQERTR